MGRTHLEQALSEITGLEDGSDIILKPVHGGDCNEAYMAEGGRWFVKVNRSFGEELFIAEAEGLKALGNVPGAPRVPKVLTSGTFEGGAFLVLEYIQEGKRSSGAMAALGAQLAHLHRTGRESRYGFSGDNYIGLTKQVNTWEDSWSTFYIQQRLLPQIEAARKKSLLNRRDHSSCMRLLDQAHRLLRRPEHASLLHGDLWGGNYLISQDGAPVLIDPAVYYGDREADIAMSELFGGYSREFYDAYHKHFPLEQGYEQRRDLYNLYHMLNHLNMFGSSYHGSVMGMVKGCLNRL